MASMSLSLIVEEDRQIGAPVFHTFPSHQDHVAEAGCACRPELARLEEIDPGIFLEIWWHWRR